MLLLSMDSQKSAFIKLGVFIFFWYNFKNGFYANLN